MEKYWKMSVNNKDELDIYIYDQIGDYWGNSYSPKDLLEDIKAESFNKINLYINSPGGDVFDGVAIYNILQRVKSDKNIKIDVHVDGMAASIASIIAMIGDNIYMPANSMLMIHNPWTYAAGNAIELRKTAEELDKICDSMKTIYLKRFNKTDEKLTELLDSETWLTADEALAYGLCDEVLEEVKIAAKFDDKAFRNYKNVPDAFLNAKNKEKLPEMDSETKVMIERINKTLKYEEVFSYE